MFGREENIYIEIKIVSFNIRRKTTFTRRTKFFPYQIKPNKGNEKMKKLVLWKNILPQPNTRLMIYEEYILYTSE